MNIGFLADSLSRNGGGLFEVQLSLAKQFVNLEQQVSVYGMRDEHYATDSTRWLPIVPQIFEASNFFNFGYTSLLSKAILASSLDVLHLHTLWKYSSIVTHSWSVKTAKPYIVTPHGMLEPWALKNSKLKKMVARFLYENRMLRNAGCLQAFTSKELGDLRNIGLKNPIAVIPNGIDLPEAPPLALSERSNQMNGRKFILFLGRIHPKKGLLHLVRAWKQVVANCPNASSWKLAIAGWNQIGHQEELMLECGSLGLRTYDSAPKDFPKEIANLPSEPSVHFLGPCFGADKNLLYSLASGFVLPSFSEGLPLTVLEAWANRVPSIISVHCNLSESGDTGASIVTAADVESVANALFRLIDSKEGYRQSIADMGRRFVEEKHQWPLIATRMLDTYRWMLNARSCNGCPDFIDRVG